MVFSNHLAGQDKNRVPLRSALLTDSSCGDPLVHRTFLPMRPHVSFSTAL